MSTNEDDVDEKSVDDEEDELSRQNSYSLPVDSKSANSHSSPPPSSPSSFRGRSSSPPSSPKDRSSSPPSSPKGRSSSPVVSPSGSSSPPPSSPDDTSSSPPSSPNSSSSLSTSSPLNSSPPPPPSSPNNSSSPPISSPHQSSSSSSPRSSTPSSSPRKSRKSPSSSPRKSPLSSPAQLSSSPPSSPAKFSTSPPSSPAQLSSSSSSVQSEVGFSSAYPSVDSPREVKELAGSPRQKSNSRKKKAKRASHLTSKSKLKDVSVESSTSLVPLESSSFSTALVVPTKSPSSTSPTETEIITPTPTMPISESRLAGKKLPTTLVQPKEYRPAPVRPKTPRQPNTIYMAPPPPPLLTKLVLPPYQPVEENLGMTVDEEGFLRRKEKALPQATFIVRFAYLNSFFFFVGFIVALVVGIVALAGLFPLGVVSSIAFVCTGLFLLASVTQLVGYLNNYNRPVCHCLVTVVVTVIIFCILTLALIQMALANHMVGFTEKSFEMRFLRYSWGFDDATITKLYSREKPMSITVSVVLLVIALIIFVWALVQCCYYTPAVWWHFILSLLLAVMCIFLCVGTGIIFASLAHGTPFLWNHVKSKVFFNGAPAGNYLFRSAVVMIVIAALLLAVVVTAVVCVARITHTDEFWPNREDTTYEYYRAKSFTMPTPSVTRNVILMICGLVALPAVIVVVVNLPYNKKYSTTDAYSFLRQECPEEFAFDDMGSFTLDSTASTSDSSYLSPSLSPVLLSTLKVPPDYPPGHKPSSSPASSSSSSFLRSSLSFFSYSPSPPPSPSLSPSPSLTANRTLGLKMLHPCTDVHLSVLLFEEVKNNIPASGHAEALEVAAHLADMTEAARKLVMLGTLISTAPLVPIVAVDLVLCVLLLFALVCYPSVRVCLRGEPDTRDDIEVDIQEWEKRTHSMGSYSEHASLWAEKNTLEKRIRIYNEEIHRKTTAYELNETNKRLAAQKYTEEQADYERAMEEYKREFAQYQADQLGMQARPARSSRVEPLNEGAAATSTLASSISSPASSPALIALTSGNNDNFQIQEVD